ncbi:ABC transporter ATP-binding protein [Bacillus cereus group sp. TH153LC]|uniref:ATP-binding cassette domain-containing protein n=1 Tax=Bacillus cereus group sp. TH153LC TaxID=3018059 RepID=UPI0022E647A7|nr:ABC transporter ATP-binding protein [Bacillus cereus group sp. TH153LC]MDA1663404.1 ABC transporter ATP-binding protein [Bacillus cereus group sp. TH153LC]
MKDELLSIKDLGVWYETGKPIIRNLDLTIYRNQVVGLIGRNGAGKTTLIKMIASILGTYHLESFLWFRKKSDVQSNNFKLNRSIIFDEDHSFEYFTFREYLEYVFDSYQKAVPDITELVRGFGFTNHQDTLIKDLSTGNRKKAFLITGFALRLPLLILDEPVNGLDFDSTEFLYQLIKNYKEYGSVLFSSHVMESITMTANQVLILENGKISQTFEGADVDGDLIRKALQNHENY